MPVFVVCAFLPDELFVTWKHAQNFMTPRAFAVGLAGLGSFALAAWSGFNFRIGHHRPYGMPDGRLIGRLRYRTLVYFILIVCSVAYLILLAPAIQDVDLIGGFFNESIEPHAMREMLGRMPGVTSLINLGPMYVTLLLLQPVLTGTKLSRFDKTMLLMFLCLVTLRVFLWSERLALVETVVPIAMIRLASTRHHRVLVAMLPLIAVAALPFFFGITEYFRSWAHFYSKMGLSLTDFVLSRLFGYYATAINNGAVIFTAFEPSFNPYHIAEWFYRFPWLSGELDETFLENNQMALSSFTNPEFNNTSGLFNPMHDLGPVGGIVVWLILGAITGYLCQGFKDRRMVGLLLYPSWVTGVYELLRIFYWGGPRYFPILAFAPFALWFLAGSALQRPRYSRQIGALPAGAARGRLRRPSLARQH